MKKLEQILNLAKNESMIYGIKRVKLSPYDLSGALMLINSIGSSRISNFTLTEGLKDLFIKLIQYLYSDDNFQGDLTKGIILQGPTGTGKTEAMEIMSKYLEFEKITLLMNGKGFRMNFAVVNVNAIINGFLQHAFEGIQQYINRDVICLDDIGTEIREVSFYGNKLDVISHIISERYTKRKLTFATSNYPKEKLEDIYTDRTVSRIYGMFNFITLLGEDFRRM